MVDLWPFRTQKCLVAHDDGLPHQELRTRRQSVVQSRLLAPVDSWGRAGVLGEEAVRVIVVRRTEKQLYLSTPGPGTSNSFYGISIRICLLEYSRSRRNSIGEQANVVGLGVATVGWATSSAQHKAAQVNID